MPPPKLTDLAPEDRAAALPDLGAERRQRRAHEPEYYGLAQRPEADLGDARRQARRGSTPSRRSTSAASSASSTTPSWSGDQPSPRIPARSRRTQPGASLARDRGRRRAHRARLRRAPRRRRQLPPAPAGNVRHRPSRRRPHSDRGAGRGRVALPAAARRPPGVAALLLGFFGLLTAVEGRLLRRERSRLSGDDYTGFSGARRRPVLLGLGVVTLWRRARRRAACAATVRRLLLAAAAGVVVRFVLFPLASRLRLTHVARPTCRRPNSAPPTRTCEFTTSDGLTAPRLVRPVEERRRRDRLSRPLGPQKHARMLVRHGYGVLLFDRRGEGESDGDPNSSAGRRDRDLNAAVDFLQTARRRRPRPHRRRSASRSAARCCSRRRPSRPGSRRSSPRAGACARTARRSIWTARCAPVALATRAIATPATALFRQRPAAAEPEGPRAEDRAPPRVLHLRGPEARGGEELNAEASTPQPDSPRRSGRSRTPGTRAGSPPNRGSTSGA